MKNIAFLALSCLVLLFSCNSCSSDSNDDVIDNNVAIEETNELLVKNALNNPINGFFIIAFVVTLLAFTLVVGLKPIRIVNTRNQSQVISK